MIQEILTYIIIAATVVITLWHFIKPMLSTKKNQHQCTGCDMAKNCNSLHCTKNDCNKCH
ncbi:MAG TPA: hypothetical protein DEO38_02970 [Bacteroidales bacterium]|nr:hypothetical protein [Bacteroidales bacterium]